MVAERSCSNHFFKVMIDDFHTKLSIPTRFSGKLNGEKIEKAVLTSYRGSWDVEVGKCGRLFHFKKGWEEFVRNHNLNIGDFVVFEQKEDLRFDVLVFDSSACEKKLSDESENKRARTAGQVEHSRRRHEKRIKLESDSEVFGKEFPRPMAAGNNNSHDHVRDSKEAAAAAFTASGRPSFTQTILSYNCVRRTLNIPRKFWRSNDIITKEPTIYLRDPLNRRWPVRVGRRSDGQRFSLGMGWSEFYKHNKLKIGDVCVFELIPTSPETPCPTLDVRILLPER